MEIIYFKVTKATHPYDLYSWGKHGEGSPKEEWFDVWEIA